MAGAEIAHPKFTDGLDAVNWGIQCLSAGPSVNHITLRRRRSRSAGTQKLDAAFVNVLGRRPAGAKIRILGEPPMKTARPQTDQGDAYPTPPATLLVPGTCSMERVGCGAQGEETELEPNWLSITLLLHREDVTLIASTKCRIRVKPGGVNPPSAARALHC